MLDAASRIRSTIRPMIVTLVAVPLLVLTGCDDGPAGVTAVAVTTATPATDATISTGVPGLTATPAVPAATATEAPASSETGSDLDEVTLYDETLVRTDVDCSRDFISSGGGERFPEAFTAAHYVVGGTLGAVCLGEEDERLLQAWNWLRLIAPAEDLDELILLAGYDTESDLLAYVEPLTARDGTVSFQMTVNLRASVLDEIEFALTMAHEFTHVFTGTNEELDRTVPPEACITYHEGEGCYVRGSYIARWIDEFWDDWIEEVHPNSAEDTEAAEARCLVDDSFLGAYAASNPEEDFAETFSAYVYSVPVTSPGLVAKYEFFEADPKLREHRERVQDFGFSPFPNQFDGCGF